MSHTKLDKKAKRKANRKLPGKPKGKFIQTNLVASMNAAALRGRERRKETVHVD